MAESFGPKVLFQKVSQILNIVRQIRARQEKTGTLPVVDFIIDNFDRTGVKGLGQYWENRGAFSVVEGLGAVSSSGNFHSIQEFTPSGAYRTIYTHLVEDAYYEKNGEYTVSAPLASGGQLARYMARLSSDNFTLTCDFELDAATYQRNDAGTDIYRVAVQAFGLVTSFDVDELGGLLYTVIASHVQDVFYGEHIKELSGFRTFVASSDGANIAMKTTVDFQRDYRYASASSTPTPLLHVGSNNLRLVVLGNTVTAYLNNTAVFSDSSGAFTKGRVIGMMALGAVGLIAGAIGHTPPAITKLKAWVDGVSEPSDSESGHGVFNENGQTYTDGYHDAEGNYNPLVFE